MARCCSFLRGIFFFSFCWQISFHNVSASAT
jgi:hypothetical protein